MADSIDARSPRKCKQVFTPEQKQRRREYHARWAKANPDKVRQYQKKHYDNHIDQRRKEGRERNRIRRLENPNYDMEVQKRYCERHPDRVRAAAKKAYATNRDAILAYIKKWRADNPDYQKQHYLKRLARNPRLNADRYAKDKNRMQRKAAEWRKTNPDSAREINNRNHHRRRGEIAASSEHYTLAEIRELKKKAGGKCAYCGKRGRTTIDHIKALSRGGTNAIRNIQFLCKSCNSSKQDRDAIEFARSRGLLL